MYSARFHEKYKEGFEKLEESMKGRVAKKIIRILEYPHKRHLGKSAKYFVAEIGQYRAAYDILEEKSEVRFYFLGDHKEYRKWYSQFF